MTTTPKSRVSTKSSQVNFGAYQHDLTAQKITSAIKELDSIYSGLAGHVRILAGDVEDGRRAVRSFDLDHRTDLKSNYDIEPLLEELTTERGLGWSDISYLCRVSVSSIRKWRAGDPIPDAQLVKLARLAAFLDMLADVGPVGHPASWLHMRFSEQHTVRPADLYIDGKAADIFEYAQGHISLNDLLDAWRPDWRDTARSYWKVIDRPDGDRVLVRRSE